VSARRPSSRPHTGAAIFVELDLALKLATRSHRIRLRSADRSCMEGGVARRERPRLQQLGISEGRNPLVAQALMKLAARSVSSYSDSRPDTARSNPSLVVATDGVSQLRAASWMAAESRRCPRSRLLVMARLSHLGFHVKVELRSTCRAGWRLDRLRAASPWRSYDFRRPSDRHTPGSSTVRAAGSLDGCGGADSSFTPRRAGRSGSPES